MIRFYAPSFAAAIGELRSMGAILSMMRGDGEGDTLLSVVRDSILAAPLASLRRALDGVPMSALLKGKLERIPSLLLMDDSITVNQAEVYAKELHNDIISDLASAWFLMIPAERRAMYTQPHRFGERVADTFPDASNDIAAAARCIALDEWTAAVFHLMRVLEHGLRWFAQVVGLEMGDAAQLENWKTIIDQIEKQIRKVENERKSPEKSERLRFYSESASNFRYFKDAWRNHVSHARATYDEREALNVWNHVRLFMQSLTAHQDGQS